MADIDITQDLASLVTQLQTLIGKLQELDGQREKLAQKIQNLNGVAMYLRVK